MEEGVGVLGFGVVGFRDFLFYSRDYGIRYEVGV